MDELDEYQDLYQLQIDYLEYSHRAIIHHPFPALVLNWDIQESDIPF